MSSIHANEFEQNIKREEVPHHRPFAAEGNNINVMIDLIPYARYHTSQSFYNLTMELGKEL